MRLLYVLIIIGCTGPVLAQTGEPLYHDVIYQIKKEGLDNSKVMDLAFHITDASGPRLSNSPGLQRASKWAVSQLEGWGLKNVELEPWGEFGRGWEVKKSYVAMTEPYYMPLIAVPKAWTPGTNGLIEKEVLRVEIESKEDFDRYEGKLEGKIVLIVDKTNIDVDFDADARRFTAEQLDNRAGRLMGPSNVWSPERIQRGRELRRLRDEISKFLIEENTAAVISGSRRRSRHGTIFTSNGASYEPDAPEVLPEVEMAIEHAMLLARLIENGIPVKVELESETQFYDDDLTGYNVIAEIPGTDKKLKDEVVMMGAHFDSWHGATGATDNGAGSIVMMEAARILQTIGIQPRRTIRLALWTSEEQGLHGSRHYVKNHFGDRETMELKPDHEKFSAYYNIDNGTGRIRGMYLQENEAVRPIFAKWFEPFVDMIDHTTLSIRNTGGTDHLSFDAIGLPGFQFIQDPISYSTRTHHTNMDTYERLLEEDLKQMAVIIASFVYHTAQREQKLPRKPLPQIKP